MIYIMLLVAIGFGLCLGYYLGILASIIAYYKDEIRTLDLLDAGAEHIRNIIKNIKNL